ncbi:MAG: DUF3808 domain-containing protein [Deltaproteobacteria bacterium]|nr:DUF3808 domain-containing protein [Deltaproteobacteria bacterium]
MSKVLSLLLLLFLPLTSGLPGMPEANPRALFSQAYTLYSTGNLSEAEELFFRTLDQDYVLSDYSLYYLGLIASKRGSPETARGFFALLRRLFPQSVWRSQAELQMAKLAIDEKDHARAMEILQSLRAQRPRREISDESLYLLAQIHEALGKLEEAHSFYQELRRSSPLSSWASKARQDVSRLREENPERFVLNTSESLSAEGELLLQERQFAEAEKVYRKVLEMVPAGNSRPALLMALANVYRAARNREKGILVLSEIVRHFPQSPEAPNALYRLARTYWNLDDNLKAMDHFNQLKKKYPASSFIDFADFASARIHESLGNTEEAIRIYRDFSKRFPASQLRQEAAWRLAWIHYLQGQHEKAYQAFKRLSTGNEGDRYQTAAYYWQARTALKMGLAEEAKGIFVAIFNAPEDSYYKGAAARSLQKMGVAFDPKGLDGPISEVSNSQPVLIPEAAFHLIRARELTEISLSILAVAELDEIKNDGGDPGLYSLLMREYARNGAYRRSVSLANRIRGSSDELQRFRYPLAYWEKVDKLAVELGLDPFLVVALIRQESLFDPYALSPASAYGLMQLLPTTAAREAKQMGLPVPNPETLFDPDVNLKIGIHHLKGLLDRYENNLPRAIAAYNAGENAVARWQRQIPAEDDEEFIERIPYAETRLYVKLVLRNQLSYRKIYNNQARFEAKEGS